MIARKSSRLLLSLLFTCATALQAQRTEPENVPIYTNFIAALPVIPLPISVKCGFDSLPLSADEREALRPFTPGGFELIGKLATHPKFNIILCGEASGDRYIPWLYVTDSEGISAGLQKLFEVDCPPDQPLALAYEIRSVSAAVIAVSYGAPGAEKKEVQFEITDEGEVKQKAGK